MEIRKRAVPGGTLGLPTVGAIVAGTSFVINSELVGVAFAVQVLDTSTINWFIVN